jgi:hypothetical protein
MLAKRTTKNQITLPKKIASRFPDVDYFDISIEDDRIVLRPVHPDLTNQARKKLATLGIAESDIAEAVEWARSLDR